MRQRRPRLRDDGYLAWLRTLPCACGCLQGPPCDAAHIRAGSLQHDKPMTGMATKPDDCWALPLKRAHHMMQHAYGSEIEWWSVHGVRDPFELAKSYYRRYSTVRQVVHNMLGKRKPVKPRKPPHLRQKLQSRKTTWPKRKFQTRRSNHVRI